MNPFTNHYYINLEERKDRNENAIHELSKLGIKPNRFDAIKTPQGIVGCCLSHIKVILDAKKRGLEYVCIFEDDLIIINPQLLTKKVNKILNDQDKQWDVLLLGGNNFKPFVEYDDYVKVSRCFTTTAYIIRAHYYDKYLNNLHEGLKLLLQTKNRDYSLDSHNHILQREDTWLLITPILVYQKEGYSDIEKRNVNYKNIMLNYEK